MITPPAGIKLGALVLDTFLEDLIEGGFAFDCADADLPRIRELVAREARVHLVP